MLLKVKNHIEISQYAPPLSLEKRYTQFCFIISSYVCFMRGVQVMTGAIVRTYPISGKNHPFSFYLSRQRFTHEELYICGPFRELYADLTRDQTTPLLLITTGSGVCHLPLIFQFGCSQVKYILFLNIFNMPYINIDESREFRWVFLFSLSWNSRVRIRLGDWTLHVDSVQNEFEPHKKMSYCGISSTWDTHEKYFVIVYMFY